ncbi:MAG: 16S rRNA (cytosine(967)-C(5))-methyltransferase RsmB [Deltaproteobacteria bacterium]
MKNPSPRLMAVDILNRIEEKEAFAEPLLDAFLSRNDMTNIHDRRLLTEIVYGTLRMRGRLDWTIRQLYRGNFLLMETGIKNILRTAMYQMCFTDRIPEFAIVDEAVEITKKRYPAGSSLVNAILRNTIRKKDEISFPEIGKDPALHTSVLYSHPLWLVERWIKRFGIDETIALCKANNDVPPYTLRVNRLKTTRNRVAEDLLHDASDVRTTLYSPDGLIISHPAVSIRETASYKSGHIQVQDEASQLIACLVDPKPGDTILDVCAGTGGKTTHLAEIMKNRGRIVAIDVNDGKRESLRLSAARQGITIIDARWGDATRDMGNEFHEAFDRVLIDAPCSGFGTLRRNPEIKWRLHEKTVKESAPLQKMMLDRSAIYVKKGGVIVYSTCTIVQEENEENIEDFLSRHRDFHQICPPETIISSIMDERKYFKTYPHRHGMDGFFGAVLVKI